MRVAGSIEERTRYSFASRSASVSCPPEKCGVRETFGRLTPAAPTRKWAAGLWAKRSPGAPPGTAPGGVSGTTDDRSGCAPSPGSAALYGWRMPM